MSTSKNILILCDGFAAPFYNPRVSNLAKNLQNMGWNIYVLSEHIPGYDFKPIFPIKMMQYYAKNRLYYLLQWIADKLFHTKEKAFFRFIEKYIDVNHYDAILCSSFHLFPIPTACKLANKYNKPFCIDLRDIAEQIEEGYYLRIQLPKIGKYDLNQAYKTYHINIRNKYLKQAQVITSVSPWHVDLLKKINPSTHLIYNGFDKNQFIFQAVETRTFNIIYTGKIHPFQQQAVLTFFKAIQLFLQRKDINKNNISVQFYVSSETRNFLHNCIKYHNLMDVVKICNYIPHEAVQETLNQASVLLVLTDKKTNRGPHGMMTTKFFEALGIEKPVLCVRSDEECLAAVIQQTNAGLAATTAEEAADFLVEKYNEWKDKGYTHQPVQNKDLFTRQNQALQFDKILRSIIK